LALIVAAVGAISLLAMARSCHKCGAEIPEGSPVCRSCFEPVAREGFLTRLLRVYSGGRVTLGKSSSPAGTKLNLTLSEKIKVRDPFTGQLREYHSLDEVPEEFREQIRKAREAMAGAKGGNLITVTEAKGNVQTYHSVEELPPDLRALYDKARSRDSNIQL
jgi:hypothetical protein